MPDRPGVLFVGSPGCRVIVLVIGSAVEVGGDPGAAPVTSLTVYEPSSGQGHLADAGRPGAAYADRGLATMLGGAHPGAAGGRPGTSPARTIPTQREVVPGDGQSTPRSRIANARCHGRDTRGQVQGQTGGEHEERRAAGPRWRRRQAGAGGGTGEPGGLDRRCRKPGGARRRQDTQSAAPRRWECHRTRKTSIAATTAVVTQIRTSARRYRPDRPGVGRLTGRPTGGRIVVPKVIHRFAPWSERRVHAARCYGRETHRDEHWGFSQAGATRSMTTRQARRRPARCSHRPPTRHGRTRHVTPPHGDATSLAVLVPLPPRRRTSSPPYAASSPHLNEVATASANALSACAVVYRVTDQGPAGASSGRAWAPGRAPALARAPGRGDRPCVTRPSCSQRHP